MLTICSKYMYIGIRRRLVSAMLRVPFSGHPIPTLFFSVQFNWQGQNKAKINGLKLPIGEKGDLGEILEKKFEF